MNVEARALGTRSELVPRFEVPLPDGAADQPLTLRGLITLTVRAEHAAADERRGQRTLRQVLTERELNAAAGNGAIRSGERPSEPLAPVDEAIRAAIEGFTDGLYLVAIDGSQHTGLDEPLTLAPDTTVTYLRLVALAGG